MLAWDDADLLARDPELPGLATLLDGERLAEALAAAGLDVGPSVAVDYVRYKPGTSCLVGFADPVSGRPIHAITYGSGEEAKAEKSRARALDCGPGEEIAARGGCVYAPEARALICVFPFDADLPSVARLYDPIRGGALLTRIFRDRPQGPPGSLVEPLAYKPGRRFVARISAGSPVSGPAPAERSQGASDLAPSGVLRFYDDLRRERAARLVDRLRPDGRLVLPRRIGGSKRHRVAAVEWMEGEIWRDRLRDPEHDGGSIRRVADALFTLHEQLRARSLSLAPSPGPLAGLDVLATNIDLLVPKLGGKASSLFGRLSEAFERVESRDALVHGDFYDKQVVLCRPAELDDGRVAIVDLDDLRRGDPREDLALCRAHWERDALFGTLSRDPTETGEELALAYPWRDGQPLPSLELFVAAALLRLAQHPFRTRQPDWQERIALILERVKTLVEAA